MHNYRSDGRRPTELRSLALAISTHPQADGSATVSHGLTSVLVTVFGPREALSKANLSHDRAILNVTVDMPLFSGVGGGKRGRGDKYAVQAVREVAQANLTELVRRILEFAQNIKSTFEPVIQTQLFPRSEININVQVLQSDGSLLQTAVNATTLALIDAGVALTDYVCAITCALHDTVPLLDVTAIEESDLPNMTVAVLPKSGKITLATLETQLAVDRFQEMLKLTGDAANAIHKEMVAAVKGRTDSLVKAMGGVGRAEGGVSNEKNFDMEE